MNDLNEVLIEGRVVRDPNAKRLESGALVCTFKIASNLRYVDREKGEFKEKATFVTVEAWKNVAESCIKYLGKGDGVRVVGKIRQSRWTTADNIQMERTFIMADHVEFKPKAVQKVVPENVKATEEGPDEVEQEEINEKIFKEEKPEESEISDMSEEPEITETSEN